MAAERRRSVRIEKFLEVKYWTNRYSVAAHTADISENGVFVDTRNPLAPGTVLALSIRLSDDPSDAPVMATGKVVWAEPMMGMGIDFLEMSPEDRDRIRGLIHAELAATSP
jgi:uncharacterized protein (TIGR02266 family)